MKIAVRYHSRGGNTRTVAEAIANAAGVMAEPIEVPIDTPVDLLFIGGGFYGGAFKGDIDPALRRYVNGLSSDTVKLLAAFSTAGVMDGARRIATAARGKGISVHSETLPFKAGTRNHRTFIKEGDLTLSAKELAVISDFVVSALNKGNDFHE